MKWKWVFRDNAYSNFILARSGGQTVDGSSPDLVPLAVASTETVGLGVAGTVVDAETVDEWETESSVVEGWSDAECVADDSRGRGVEEGRVDWEAETTEVDSLSSCRRANA